MKISSWKGYIFLISGVSVTLLMFLLDPIAQITNEGATGVVLALILIVTIVSIVMAIIAFSAKKERKLIPSIALIFTVFNLAIIIFFLWFGANLV
ncbi:hypothetical protein H5P36_25735 [Bacillus sp. APMAM]|nr:hypothetical protein [Bacillus sp. APMAM]RTZ53043.1 hypothetical protein EKO25_25580 [Bacillus sp. SAJ1]